MNVIVAWLGVVAVLVLVKVVVSLVGDEVKGWMVRIPAAILWVAARRVPLSHRDALHEDWKADLAHQLQDKSDRPITRLVFGVRFATGLVINGRQVAVELGSLRTTGEIPGNLASASAAIWSSGPPEPGDRFVAFFRQAYGLGLKLVKRGEWDGEEIYRASNGDLIRCASDGACGSSYWTVRKLIADGDGFVELVRCRTINQTGKVQEVRMQPYTWRGDA